MADLQIDVRGIPGAQRHPAVFAAYDGLAPGAALVLVNDHEPRHLREEFAAEHPGSHSWEHLRREPRDRRVRIGKLSATPLPRVLADTGDDPPGGGDGASWRLEVRDRDLDANVVRLAPGGAIGTHAGPGIDVLVHVLSGSGVLTTELGAVDLLPGALLWLPRQSLRGFTAGDAGLRYLTVHQRRRALVIGPTRSAADEDEAPPA